MSAFSYVVLLSKHRVKIIKTATMVMPEKQQNTASWMLAALLLCVVGFSSASEHLRELPRTALVNSAVLEIANGSNPLLETQPGNADAILPRDSLQSVQSNSQLQPRSANGPLDYPGVSNALDWLVPAAYAVSQAVLFNSYTAEFHFVAPSLFSRPYAPRSPPNTL